MTNASVMTFNILSILPILVLSGFGMIVLVTDLVSSRKLGDKNYLAYISLLGIIIAAILSRNSVGTTLFSFSESFAIDNYSLFFNFIFLLSTGLTILISHSYIKREEMITTLCFLTLSFSSAQDSPSLSHTAISSGRRLTMGNIMHYSYSQQ